jgi:hypothetical protein
MSKIVQKKIKSKQEAKAVDQERVKRFAKKETME